MIYGDLELHPFIYQKGKNAGQANAGPEDQCQGLALCTIQPF